MNQLTAILSLKDITLSFGGVTALNSINFSVREKEILAVIGPNGAGKTCIINCINGYYQPDKGEIHLRDKKINGKHVHEIAKMGIARTFQNLELFTGLTTLENLMAARHLLLKPNPIFGALYFGREERKEIEHRKAAEEIIEFLEIQSIRNQTVGILPYGLRKRVELGRALAMEPQILLLDEPMAGMNLEEKEDMARFIIDIHEQKGITIFLIEHDMDVVMDIADRIIAIDFGSIIAEGLPAEIVENETVIKAYLGMD